MKPLQIVDAYHGKLMAKDVFAIFADQTYTERVSVKLWIVAKPTPARHFVFNTYMYDLLKWSRFWSFVNVRRPLWHNMTCMATRVMA